MREVKLTMQLNKGRRVYIRGQDDLRKLVQAGPMRLRHREELVALFMSYEMELIGKYCVAIGAGDRAVVDMHGLYAGALLSCAKGVILVHNHPLASLEPSEDDKNFARTAGIGLRCLSLELLDFVIINETGKTLHLKRSLK